MSEYGLVHLERLILNQREKVIGHVLGMLREERNRTLEDAAVACEAEIAAIHGLEKPPRFTTVATGTLTQMASDFRAMKEGG